MIRATIKTLITTTLLLGSQALWAQEAAPAAPAEPPPLPVSTLDELLEEVRQGYDRAKDDFQAREQRFVNSRNEQARLLDEAKAERRRLERRSDELETTFENNEAKIADLTVALDKRLGSLRELFGVLQQVAGDSRGVFSDSIISAQVGLDRVDEVAALAQKMGTSSKLATIEEMERLWYLMQQEMTESGKVVKFRANIAQANGEKVEKDVVRVGAFNLVADGEYLKFEDGQIKGLPRQPESQYVAGAEALSTAGSGEVVPFGVDPSRGQLLGLLIQTKTLEERIADGREVGYVIIVLGIIGVLIAL